MSQLPNVTKSSLPCSESELVRRVSDFLYTRYIEGKHHAACILVGGGRFFYGLHLDSDGHDVCAEVGAFSHALVRGDCKFDLIVTVLWDPKGKCARVVAPCGDCRQLLMKFAPNLQVLIAQEKSIIRVKIRDLLPYAYEKTQ